MSQHICVVWLLTFSSCFTGELPKQLPVSLEVLNLGESRFGQINNFTGGIPSEWGALTNLKELKMVACGLDGAICMSQHTCVILLLTVSLFFAGELPKELSDLVNLERFHVSSNKIGGELYVPSYTLNLVTHMTEFWCVHCTVTEEEKAALRAKLPKIVIFDI